MDEISLRELIPSALTERLCSLRKLEMRRWATRNEVKFWGDEESYSRMVEACEEIALLLSDVENEIERRVELELERSPIDTNVERSSKHAKGKWKPKNWHRRLRHSRKMAKLARRRSL